MFKKAAKPNGKFAFIIPSFFWPHSIYSSVFGLALLLNLTLSISLLNFTGVTTTKKGGALAGSTIDTSRTWLIWLIIILVRWKYFIPFKLAQLYILLIWMAVYYEILLEVKVERSICLGSHLKSYLLNYEISLEIKYPINISTQYYSFNKTLA